MSRRPGPPRLEIINTYQYIIETGPKAGNLLISGEVINRGGAAWAVWLTTEVFAPDGSRLLGTTSSILGRVQRNANTGQVENWGLGAGETGCFGDDLGPADRIGRYQTGMRVEADPTTALAGQLRAGLTYPWYISRIMGYPELVVFPEATNVGSIPTAWNSVAFMGKDTAGRVVACGQHRVYGSTNGEVPGYGFTNVLRPGETAYPLNGQAWVNSSYHAAALTSLTSWPLWKE